MAISRKYAALPDLDSAPDIYETPELTDDNSTAPTGRDRSQSTASSYKDFDDEDDEAEIDRARFDPNKARSLFSPAQIDARDVDFSDRVTAKRKSYKTSTRRQRLDEDDPTEFGDFTDEEDGESLDRRLARLRREVEEVKDAYSRREAERKAVSTGEEPDGQDIGALSKILDSISTSQAGGPARRLAKNLSASSKLHQTTETSQSPDSATYTVTYAPNYQQSHALAKAADFDNRLAMLEKVLGLNTTDLPFDYGSSAPKAILPTLETLQKQIAVISSSTPSSLDAISRRIRTLTHDALKLEESRKNAKAAQDSLRAGGDPLSAEDEDGEQVAKINALYGTLSTIDNLSPLLPSVLDRLRSLRAIHAYAATANESLEKVEQRQADMAGDLEKWAEGLRKVEEALQKSETLTETNMKTVQGWVQDLEVKMERL